MSEEITINGIKLSRLIEDVDKALKDQPGWDSSRAWESIRDGLLLNTPKLSLNSDYDVKY
jgi:hypothetical protein